MTATKLQKVSYYDAKSEVRLECYADTIVTEQEERRTYIAAIRLGGYPESVKGMSDAIYGGGSVTVDINGEDLTLGSRVKQYYREYSHDGLYAEAVLRIKDDQRDAGLLTAAAVGTRVAATTNLTPMPPASVTFFAGMKIRNSFMRKLTKRHPCR